MLAKIKQFIKLYQAEIILAAGVILISLLSFAVGYIVAEQQEKEPLKFERHESSKNSHYWSRDSWFVSGLEAFRKRS